MALKGNIRIRTIYRSAIEAAAYKKQLAEEMRLLYVAMTRAMDRIIMIGGIRGAEKKLAALDKPLTDGAINKSKIIFGLDFAGSDEYRKRELVQAASGHDRHCGKLYN